MKSILFFTPYAGRTGSEMFLFYMLSKAGSKFFKSAVLSDAKGELLQIFPTTTETFVSLKYPNKMQRLRQMIASLFGRNLYDVHIEKVHRRVKPDVWYLNTVLMMDKVRLAKKCQVPVVLHFHELPGDFAHIQKHVFKEAIEYATMCVADSQAVLDKLRIMGAKNAVLQFECVDTEAILADAERTERIKSELGLGRFDFIWMMSGTSIARKGVDLVPRLAAGLKKNNAALVWVGNNTENGLNYFIEKEIAYMGLDNVFFLGKKTTNYYDYMNIMDGFVLTSREEPFGMVVVEALALGKPVVAFDAGGVSEILTEDTGRIVSSWNLEDLVSTLNECASDLSWFRKESAKERARLFSIDAQFDGWVDILKKVCP